MENNLNLDQDIQQELFELSELLNSGDFHEALVNAQSLISRSKVSLNRASCHFILGCAMHELGDSLGGLANILEALFMFPSDEPALCGNAQFQIAKIQFDNTLLTSALFFVDLAIANFELLPQSEENFQIIERCNLLKIQIKERQTPVH